MKVIDQNGEVLNEPDLSLGCLVPDKLLIAHHPQQPEVREQSHTEVLKTYANGGKDLIRVVDVPFSPAKDAWDEYEDVMRYLPYTPQELEERNKPSEMEVLKQENKKLRAQIDALCEQNSFHEQLIVELAQETYA